MKNIKLFAAAALILTASSFTVIKLISWKVKDDYSVKSGIYTFKGLKATILFDEENPEKSKIMALIDARTIDTGNELQNMHAREALGADKFHSITFASTAVARTAGGYETTGDLTLKGVTKKITIPFTFDSKSQTVQFPFFSKQTFHGMFTIAPKDFNVTREGTPAQVTIDLTIPVTQ